MGPKGLTFEETTSGADAIYVIIDGSPSDVIMKLSTSTGAINTSYGTSGNGTVAGPSDELNGITFLNNYFYVVGRKNNDPYLWKLVVATGEVAEDCGSGSDPCAYQLRDHDRTSSTAISVLGVQFRLLPRRLLDLLIIFRIPEQATPFTRTFLGA